MSLAVVTWQWGTKFGPEYVRKLRSMLDRHLHAPFTFHCITDDDAFLGERVVRHPMFTEHGEMAAGRQACFRRLRLLDRETGLTFGPRVLQLDLDTVLTDDVTPLFDRPEPVVIVRQGVNQHPGDRKSPRVIYNPSMLLFDAGALHEVWARFHADPEGVWKAARGRHWQCSDMAVLNDWFDRDSAAPPASWDAVDGVMSYWRDIKRAGGALPPGTRAALFYGPRWNLHDAAVQEKCPWIEVHWR